MSFFDFFRRKPTNEHALLEQLLQNQQMMMERIESLSQQIDGVRANMSRTSISTSIKTVSVPADTAHIPHITEFLHQKNITVKTVPAPQPHDEVFNEIALVMGNKYANIGPLLDRIKRNMQQANSFQLAIANETQQAISDMTSLAQSLHKLTLLHEYSYKKSPQCIIYARPSAEPRVQNFFSGQWLERFMASTVKFYADEAGIPDFEILTNPQIILPNGNDFELDIIFHANRRIYWVECKTGTYQAHLPKYSRMANDFDLPTSQMLMILPDADDATTAHLSRMYHMQAMNLMQAHDFLSAELHR